MVAQLNTPKEESNAMYILMTTVTLFLRSICGERRRLAFFFLCLILLCVMLVLIQLGQLHHWHTTFPGQHSFLADDQPPSGQTPWDGGD